jgi:hypothetical protein
MPAATDGPPTESARRAVEAVWWIESARMAIVRSMGNFAVMQIRRAA